MTSPTIKALEALKAARQYIEGAYECAFPDDAANEAALRDVDEAIAALESDAQPAGQPSIELKVRGEDHRFFSYCPDNGALWHETAVDARGASNLDLVYYRDAAKADGEWSADVENVCWGEIRGRAIGASDQLGTDFHLDGDAAPLASGLEVLPAGVELQAYRIGRGSDAITVERATQRQGPDLWAVRQHGNVLNKQGEWEFEPQPSSRDAEFLARCRFATHTEAINAVRQAPLAAP